MPGKTYVVIGSNCFTGCHIVDGLLERYPECRVIGVSRSPEYKDLYLPYKRHQDGRFIFRQLDLVRGFPEVADLLDQARPAVVVNVAALSEVALSNERPVEYFEINTLAVVKLCNHLRARSGLERYVHISSAEVYGSCDAPVTEETRFNPSTPYAASKAAADLYINALIKNFRFPATLIRTTNVYGKHQQLFKIIPRTAIFIKMGRTIELQGGGAAIKSFVHIRDVVRGLLLALERGGPGAYHFTVPSEATVAEIVRRTAKMMGADFDRATKVVGDRLGQDARYWLDCTKAERELGWRPLVSFEEGVGETIAWIEENWRTIQGEPLVYVHKV